MYIALLERAGILINLKKQKKNEKKEKKKKKNVSNNKA
jgi:hypothetical protein